MRYRKLIRDICVVLKMLALIALAALTIISCREKDAWLKVRKQHFQELQHAIDIAKERRR